MDELNKTNRLLMVVIAIVLVIVVGLISFHRPEVSYALSPTESISLLNNSANYTTPGQLADLMRDSSGKVVLVDVRNSIEFGQQHFKNAINIPVRELFTKKSRQTFREISHNGQIAVLYGSTPLQANGPWLMLQQTGFKNVRLFTGVYSQLDMTKADSLTRLLPPYSEIPEIDTAALKSISVQPSAPEGGTKAASDPKLRVIPSKKSGSSGGGC